MIAAWNYPDLDVEAALESLNVLGQSVAERVAHTTTLPERLERLVHALSVEEHFRGNIEEYYEPRNSFLNDVLTTRCGLPISLAVIYMHVARHAGIDLRGVAAPGHFITRAELASGEPIFVDPFYGVTLTTAAVRERYRAQHAGDEELPLAALEPVDSRRILLRMLANLKYLYVAREDADRALACCERSLAIEPDSPPDLRDRGLLLLERESFRAGIADLARYLELAPNEQWSDSVRARLAAAQRLLDTLN
jgi:regulator of sirC expression with transglutaminase-like and TPR domain